MKIKELMLKDIPISPRFRELWSRIPRDFFLFPSFAKTMGFYHVVLALAFVLLIGAAFYHFLTTLLEITTAVTDADKELIAFVGSYITRALGWIFALIGAFMVCCVFLVNYGAKKLIDQTSSLQSQVEKLVSSDFTARTSLQRKNEFYPLAEKLNTLAQTLEKSHPPTPTN